MSSAPTTTVVDWKPSGVQHILAFTSKFVGLMEDGCSVVKYPHHPTDGAEAEQYRRLGPHQTLVKFMSMADDGLLHQYCE